MVEYDNGYVHETVEVNGSTVTVGADDGDLRERILSSATTQDICRARLDAPPRAPHEPSYEETVGEMVSARVCAYASDGDGFALVYAAPLQQRVVRATGGAR